MIVRRNNRSKKTPLPKKNGIPARFMAENVIVTSRIIFLEPHQLRKQELSRIHGIPESDIFVDPRNGVELYRNIKTGGWVHNPANRGVE